MTPLRAKREFDKSMEHVIAAYRFFSQTVPNQALFAAGRPVRIGDFEFERFSQSEAMTVELGWAFFTRCEGCLEALIHRLKKSLREVSEIVEKSGEFSPDELRAWHEARELRNIFHHGDGDGTLLKNRPTRVVSHEDHEPHLFPEHIERFHSLFCRIAECIARPHLRAV